MTLIALVLALVACCRLAITLTKRDARIGYLEAELSAAEADLRRSQARKPFGYRATPDCPRKDIAPGVRPTRPVFAGYASPPARVDTVPIDVIAWDAEWDAKYGQEFRHVADGRPAHFRPDGTLVLPHDTVPTVSQLAQMLAA